MDIYKYFGMKSNYSDVLIRHIFTTSFLQGIATMYRFALVDLQSLK